MSNAVRRHDPRAVPVPYMVPGFTDAKNFHRLGTRCYEFSPIRFDPTHEIAFAALYHGHDERIPVDGFLFGLRLLYDVVRTFAA
jgi:acetylornithine deacetylase/succinyl-diaminopimelate desuccinylase-like protein